MSANTTVQKKTMEMEAITQKGYGAPERVLELEKVDRPSVGDDDVLIRMRATSVNTPDWITVAGVPYILRLQSGLRRPSTPVRGTDVAGVVEAVGKNVTDLQPGDEVFGSSWADTLANRAGTFAEFTVAPASQLINKPVGLTFEEAAASVMSGLTALIAVRDVGRVGPGTRVLINGASGGVGTLAVQIAKALGAEVTGVCSTRNLELVRSLGADQVIDYTDEDFTSMRPSKLPPPISWRSETSWGGCNTPILLCIRRRSPWLMQLRERAELTIRAGCQVQCSPTQRWRAWG